jgi:hypothetical protein
MSLPIGLENFTDVRTSTEGPEYSVGAVYTDNSTGNRYCYVENAGASATVVGDVCGVFLTSDRLGEISTTAATTLVNNDGTLAVTVVAGIALGAIAAGGFGWLQVGGFCSNVTTDTNCDASEGLYCADDAKVAAPLIANAQHGCFGVCITADGATSTSTGVLLTNCAFDA